MKTKGLAETQVICFKCNTLFKPEDTQCPQCGCKTVMVVKKRDVRQPFSFDERQQGPI